MQEHMPRMTEAEFEEMLVERRQAADLCFDRLLLSRYHRSLADLELFPDPEGRWEADHVLEFSHEIADHLQDLLRAHRGEDPENLRRRRQAADSMGEDMVSFDPRI